MKKGKKETVKGIRIKRGVHLDTYDGEVDENGLPCGRGTAREDNGTYYEGEWKDGAKVGQGIMYFANGNILDATWDDNPVRGTWTFTDGAVYKGEFNSDWQYHGKGILTLPCGKIIKGYWENGEHFKGKYDNGYVGQGEVK